MSALIALLTDFGHADPYVGQMKAALLRHAPCAIIVDLCHDVQPHCISHAAFILRASYAHFPERAIFACVVDPGVGSSRSLIAAQWHRQTFLAPDNGLLAHLAPLGAQFWRLQADMSNVSNTFHGRDIIAPIAARLACGATLTTLGCPLDPAHIQPLPTPQPEISASAIRTHVVHVDRFGNCLLDVPCAAMPAAPPLWNCDGQAVHHVRTYADLRDQEIGLLPGSQGVMELACNQKSCAQLLGLKPGSPVLLHHSEELF